MAVTAAFCPLSLDTLRDANDARIVGGYIYVYAAGTTSLITTYADAGLTTANPNPLRSDGFGRIPPFYLGLGAYKVVLQDASGAQLQSIDGLPGGVDYAAQAVSAAQTVGTTLAQAQTGDVKAKHGFSVDAGWVLLNGKTIGSSATSATARANDDTKSLFAYLWNCDPSLVVSGGRGVSATADFNAAKTIALPDYRGRIPCGCDQMGADATAGVLTSASTSTPNLIGAKLGVEAVTLSQAQLPAVAPTITVQAAGGHTPAGTIGNAGAHNHGGTTGNGGSHFHVYRKPNENTVGAGSGGITANAGATNANTDTAPDHQHPIAPDGDHIHPLTMNAVPDHTHAASSSNLGSGAAHPNMPPAILVYWHIKI